VDLGFDVRLTKLTFLDNEVTDNGPHDKANPFVMRGGKVVGLLREKMVELLKD